MNLKRTGLCALCFLASAASGAFSMPVRQVVPGRVVEVRLESRQEVELEFSTPRSSPPGSLIPFELHLHGGLIAVRSSDMPRWGLDLGKGATVQYVVRSSAEGKTVLILSSLEAARQAEVEVQMMSSDATDDATDLDLQRLQDSERALATADSARRRWQGAPEPAVAELEYDRAAALATQLKTIPLLRLALTQKARFLLFEKSRFEQSRALLVQAVRLPSDGDSAQQALTYKTLSSVEAFLANYKGSIAAGEQALELYKQTGDIYWQGVVLGNLSSSYEEAGRMVEASAAAHQAAADAEATQDAAGVVYSLGQLADIDRRQGQFSLALGAFRDAKAWVHRISYAPLVEAEIEKELGLFYAQLGLWDEAEAQLRSCLIHEQGRTTATSVEVQGVLAAALQHKGKLQQAIRAYTTSIELARTLHLPREENILLLQRISALLLAESYPEALADLDRASTIAHDLQAPALVAQVELARGAFYRQRKQNDSRSQASTAYEAALSVATQTGDREQQAAALAGLAAVQRQAGDLGASLHSIDSALAIVEGSRSSLQGRGLSVSYFAQYRQWYELAVDSAMQRSRLYPGTARSGSDVRLAFQYAERMKARALLDTLTQSGALPPAGLSSDLQHRIASNQRTIEEQQALLSTKSGGSERASAGLKRLYEQQDILNAEARLEQVSLATTGIDNATTLTGLQHNLLTHGSIFLSYSVGERRSYRWAVTSSRVTAYTLPGRVQLARLLHPLQQALLAHHPKPRSGEDVAAYALRKTAFDGDLRRYLAEVGAVLLKDIPSSTSRVYLAADGQLLSIPWSALRVPCKDHTCYAMENFEILHEPSASVALYLAEHPAPPVPLRAAIIANPLAATALGGKILPSLPGADREATAIAQLLPTSLTHTVRGKQATPTGFFRLAAERFSIFHFAAHTTLIPNHPELAGIALSTAQAGETPGGTLWLRDIEALHLSPSLVVLSGCDTQVGQETAGEGLNSLSQAFFFAGARSVVGSLWEIDDDTTVDLMQHFYRNLIVRRMLPAAALRSAQRTLLRQDASPLTWAAFVVNGLSATSSAPMQRTAIGERPRP